MDVAGATVRETPNAVETVVTAETFSTRRSVLLAPSGSLSETDGMGANGYSRRSGTGQGGWKNAELRDIVRRSHPGAVALIILHLRHAPMRAGSVVAGLVNKAARARMASK